MSKYKPDRRSVQKKYLKQNRNPAEIDDFPELDRVQKRIYRQAALAGLTVILTVVILFAVTSAWYTNIVQTSGLVFQAESWGFDGTIIVEQDSILASPGDDGIIHLEVENESDSISAVSLNVSKANMTDDMKKRLFFYVDTRMSRNEEILDRVYVNNYENYTYTIFGRNNLILTEQTNNAPQLKWEWVYDVLGYYVMAQPVTYASVAADNGASTDATQATEPVTGMIIRDYLRPVEYDYDKATFKDVIQEDGKTVRVLDTVDGVTSVEHFLQKLTKTDGYKGSYNPKPTEDGYYAVDVDDSGYGVYIYLCTPTEVVMENQIDSDLGKMAYNYANDIYIGETQEERLRSEAVLTLSAQKNESTAVNINTLSGLQGAIAAGTADVIQLGNDISIEKNEPLYIPAGSRIMLDLNGNSITSKTGTAIYAMPGSQLTMINGVMQCLETHTDSRECAVYSRGAEVVMSNITMTDYEYAVYVGDNEEANQLDSRVHMVDCEINATMCAAFVSGNGLLSGQKTQLVVERCDLRSDLFVISGNGDTSGNGRWGTDIQVIDSTLTGNVATVASGIYQPQKDSVLTVYNSHVSGYNGIAIKGGTARIIGSTVSGQGAKKIPAVENSGYTDTGDAVYIDTGYGYDILLEVSDILAETGGRPSVLTSDYGYSLQVFEENANNVAVKISGGEFDEEQPEQYLVKNAYQIANSNGGVTVRLQEEAPAEE